LREFGFDVDADDGALSLERHPRGLAYGAEPGGGPRRRSRRRALATPNA
jgi:hypothetical protein